MVGRPPELLTELWLLVFERLPEEDLRQCSRACRCFFACARHVKTARARTSVSLPLQTGKSQLFSCVEYLHNFGLKMRPQPRVLLPPELVRRRRSRMVKFPYMYADDYVIECARSRQGSRDAYVKAIRLPYNRRLVRAHMNALNEVRRGWPRPGPGVSLMHFFCFCSASRPSARFPRGRSPSF
jgi:hypothetical protein